MPESDPSTDVLQDFLVEYVAYCALAEVVRGDASPEAKSNATGMATIALNKLWQAHRTCREAGIPLEELRSAMHQVVPEFANVALF